MLSVKNLSYSYGRQTTLAFPNLDVAANASLLVLGNSGSGKTTLLHLIAGLIKQQQGEISLKGQNISDLPEAEMDGFRGKNIGLVFQQPRLISALSVYDNIRISQYFNKINEPKSIDDLLSDLGLFEKKSRKPNSLSQGERQRLSLARALINRPILILADEPTASLDNANTGKVINILMEQSIKHHATLLIATHDERVKVHFDQKVILT